MSFDTAISHVRQQIAIASRALRAVDADLARFERQVRRDAPSRPFEEFDAAQVERTRRRDSARLHDQLSQLQRTTEHLAVGLSQLRDHLASSDVPSTGGPSSATLEGSPCLKCNRRDSCTAPCEEVAAMLPGLDEGRRQTANVPLRILSSDRRPRSWHEERHQAFMAVSDELTPEQFKVVSLVYGEAITQAEAAERLGRSPSTISEHIKKAEATLARARRQAIASERTSDLARLIEQLNLDQSALKLDGPDSG